MATMNVGQAITPAINHTERVLFKPFAIKKWLALGFVSLVAGFGEGGGGHINVPTGGGGKNGPEEAWEEVGAWVAGHLELIVAGIVVLVLIGLALSWSGSVMRFVYLNQITRDPYAIREPFRRLMKQGTSLFLWRLALGLIMLLALGILVGLPIGLVISSQLTSNIPVMVLVIGWCIIAGLAIVIVGSVIDLFAGDFVSAAMFVRDIRVMEGWRVVLPVLSENRGQSVLYVLMVIVIGLATAIGAMFALLAVGLVLAIVGGLFALIGYGIYVAAGNAWSSALIGYSALVGSVLFIALIYAMGCVMQPFEVFRRAYALVVIGQAEPSLATIHSGQAAGG